MQLEYHTNSWGVSIVVCCYNSAGRLPPTLTHLAAQEVKTDLPWEVIVIDNASTDGTADAARAAWSADAPAELRVIHEPEPGLTHARYRGLREARYELISFVDDDNWVCPEWVQGVSDIMLRYPGVGACGSHNEAVFESAPPVWIEDINLSAVARSDAPTAGEDVTFTQGWLYGAGLTVRRTAWQELIDAGFRSQLVDRQGSSLTTGGDVELCLALVLAGWRLRYEPSLRLKHFTPATRLAWPFLRRQRRGTGAATVVNNAYRLARMPEPASLQGRVRQTWQWQSLKTTRKLLRYRHKLVQAGISRMEGDPACWEIEYYLGQLKELLRQRGAYSSRIATLRQASWRLEPRPTRALDATRVG